MDRQARPPLRLTRSRQEAYCVFSGGGAMGACHVGVLRAIEDAPDLFRPAGYGGASAGALVALLAAAGFSAERMIGPLEGGRLKTHLDEIDDPQIETATDLLQPGWPRIRALRDSRSRRTMRSETRAWRSPSMDAAR